MKILYYTTGITGWGRVIIGISIFNALKRKNINCEYIIISNSDFTQITDGIRHFRLPVEDENALSPKNYLTSILYNTIVDISPDIILFDLNWFSAYNFIETLTCKKVFLYHQTANRFFSMDLPGKKLTFKPDHYDSIIAIEPIKPPFEAVHINPVVFRNRDEILPEDEARRRLKIAENRQACLFSFNPKLGDYEGIKKKYSYLSDIYQVINTNDHRNGLFPQVDYFNAFDFIVCSGGYNQFWEARFFEKDAVFEPIPLTFENQGYRIDECGDYTFTENGADQLAEIILNM